LRRQRSLQIDGRVFPLNLIQTYAIFLNCHALFEQRDQQFEFMTGRDMGLGTEWGNVKDLVSGSSSSSSSSSGRGGLKDNGIAITITPPVLHQSGDMVEVGRGEWKGGLERKEMSEAVQQMH